MGLDEFREALKHTNSNENRYGNELTLDCGHTIFADPNWNELALASAIEDHKNREHNKLK